ncbi:rRNA N-glycosidase [Rhynchospora pubera]|uniref:rRNA N-glycosylase n=1 Tax=Rhynchospora pubera TaxID=906938 RepID=A0AAV8CJF7_9POAL|nr:rRNA N-glycosidase [Rhynchospora pubera]
MAPKAKAPKKRSKVEKGTSSEVQLPSSNVPIQRFEFKVENKADYKKYIHLLWEQFIDPTRVQKGIPMLPVEKEPTGPADFLEVLLQTEESGVVLLLKRDNVYLVGFKAENSIEYYELRGKNSKSKIPSSIPSIWSGISENYLVLAPKLEQLLFNEGTIRNAINLLANFKPTIGGKNTGKADGTKQEGEKSASKGKGRASNEDHITQVKRAIAKLIVSICEAIRLQSVEDFVSEQLQNFDSKSLGSHNLHVDVRKWALWSRKILDSDALPTEENDEDFQRKMKLLKPCLEAQ